MSLWAAGSLGQASGSLTRQPRSRGTGLRLRGGEPLATREGGTLDETAKCKSVSKYDSYRNEARSRSLPSQAIFSCPLMPRRHGGPTTWSLSELVPSLLLTVQKAHACSVCGSSVPVGVSWGLWLESGFWPPLDDAQGDGLGFQVIASVEENLMRCSRGLGYVSGPPLWSTLGQQLWWDAGLPAVVEKTGEPYSQAAGPPT